MYYLFINLLVILTFYFILGYSQLKCNESFKWTEKGLSHIYMYPTIYFDKDSLEFKTELNAHFQDPNNSSYYQILRVFCFFSN